ncbi:MAG: DUF721 domain-containing protein [Actinobacteria bacterium]|nr:DUF721 domain-containing protein [Actinomycetota bacterium]
MAADVPDDIALAALQRVRRSGRDSAGAERRTSRRRQYSGAGPDARDPQLLGDAMTGWSRGNGHDLALLTATLRDGWQRIVGELVASHLVPVDLSPLEEAPSEYRLLLEADSPAWEHQARYLVGTIKEQIASEFGGRCAVRTVSVQLAGRRGRRTRR